MDERLKQQLEFVLEIDKEKNIFRQTHLSGHGRNENDAEHAWHMAIMAYLLREYSKMQQKSGFFPCSRKIRSRNWFGLSMSSKHFRRRRRNLPVPWITCSHCY